jgi:hypothetical protein
LPAFLLGDEFGADLCLVMTVGKQMFGWNSKLGTDLEDRFFRRCASNFDIGLHVGHMVSLPFHLFLV